MTKRCEPLLGIRHLTKRYRGMPVVDDVSFDLDAGQVTGYLGPNGSGKSTTVKMIAGLVEPSSGQILLDGRPVQGALTAVKRRLGYVPEESEVYPSLTAQEYLELVGRLRGLEEPMIRSRSADLLQLFGLHYRRHSPLAAYSRGMRQRVLISAALIHDPSILILDEPLSGLDVETAMLIRRLVDELASRGKAVLYISHVLEVIEKVCSRVIVLYKGRIVANDEIDALRTLMNQSSLEEIFSALARQNDGSRIAREIADVVTR